MSSPQDYTLNHNRSYPLSCCNPNVTDVSRQPIASPIIFRAEDAIDAIANSVSSNSNLKSNVISSNVPQPIKTINASESNSSWSHILQASREESKTNTECKEYKVGCVEKLSSWLKSTADILFVLGYCVIAFLKLCFLGILRYEIKEMIQKIKLMQTEMASAILCIDPDQQLHQTVSIRICVSCSCEPQFRRFSASSKHTNSITSSFRLRSLVVMGAVEAPFVHHPSIAYKLTFEFSAATATTTVWRLAATEHDNLVKRWDPHSRAKGREPGQGTDESGIGRKRTRVVTVAPR